MRGMQPARLVTQSLLAAARLRQPGTGCQVGSHRMPAHGLAASRGSHDAAAEHAAAARRPGSGRQDAAYRHPKLRGDVPGRWRRRGVVPTRQQLDLNQELHGCTNFEEMLRAIERARARNITLNTVNIITALNRLAKLRSPGKSARAEELLQEVLLRALQARLAIVRTAVDEGKHADIGSRELATLAWSLAKVKANDQCAAVWDVLEDIMVLRGFLDFPPRALSTMVWALAAAGRRRPQVLARLEGDLEAMDMAAFGWRDLTSVLWALASVGRSSSGSTHASGPETPVPRAAIFRRIEAAIVGIPESEAGGHGVRVRRGGGAGKGKGGGGGAVPHAGAGGKEMLHKSAMLRRKMMQLIASRSEAQRAGAVVG